MLSAATRLTPCLSRHGELIIDRRVGDIDRPTRGARCEDPESDNATAFMKGTESLDHTQSVKLALSAVRTVSTCPDYISLLADPRNGGYCSSLALGNGSIQEAISTDTVFSRNSTTLICPQIRISEALISVNLGNRLGF
jgi:hypothetical protein